MKPSSKETAASPDFSSDVRSGVHAERLQAGMRSPNSSLRPHLRIQSHPLPPSQHSRLKKPHGVVPDFIKKLKENPKELEVLGDGNQTKSYLHISDCIEAMPLGLKTEKQVEVYNVGSEDQIPVKTIAEIIIKEMGLRNVKLRFTGAVQGGGGWIGDVRNMLLHIGNLKSLGWKPKLNSLEAVKLTAKSLIKNL